MEIVSFDSPILFELINVNLVDTENPSECDENEEDCSDSSDECDENEEDCSDPADECEEGEECTDPEVPLPPL